MNETDILTAPFSRVETSLADIVAAGWYIEHSSGGGWWFRHRHTQIRHEAPRWVEELIIQARNAGMDSIQRQLKELVQGEARYLGICVPFNPKELKKKSPS